MATAAVLKGFLSKMSLPVVEHPSCWGVIKIENLLQDIGVSNYELANETRVVSIAHQEDFMRILLHLVPYEVSKDYHLTLSKSESKVRLQIGCWQFESHA